MARLKVVSLFAFGILVWAFLGSGCSSVGSLSLTLSPATVPALNPGQTQTITAAVTNDVNNEGVTWSLSGPGSLSDNLPGSVVYIAPSTVQVTSTATITATSVANTTVTATATITINAVLTITTTSLPPGNVGIPYPTSFINAAGATAPFTWAITSGSLPPGLTLGTNTSSSVSITGTPTTLGTFKFTIQVTDAADASVSQALSITIDPPPPLSVTTASLVDGTVGTTYSQQLQASSGTMPYTWSIIGTLPPGLVLTGDLISGTPAASGTYPFTVQVMDSSSPVQQTASANLSITINQGTTDNSKLRGNYAFLVRGFDNSSSPAKLFVTAGSFVSDGAGNISSGILDANEPGTLPVNQSFTGTYSLAANNLGTMTFNPTGGTSRTFAFAMSANGNARIIEFDDSKGSATRDSGVLLQQQPSTFSTALSLGSYAFGFLGVDSNGNRYGLAGEFHSTGSGSFDTGALDSDDGVSGPIVNAALTGTYSVASDGRGTAAITTLQGTTSYSFYVVNATELLMMEIDTVVPGGDPLVAGTVLQQSGNGSFANGSLNGTSVFYTTAQVVSGITSTVQAQAGDFVTDGGGNLTLSADLNTGGVLTQPTGAGTYSVASNGRVTLTNSGFQTSDPVLYLVSPNQAFIIGTDPAVTAGSMQPQLGAPFTNASLSGTYEGGSIEPAGSSVGNDAGIALASNTTITFTTDNSTSKGLGRTQVTEGIASLAATGRVVLTENGSDSAILYLVSPSQFFSLSTEVDPRIEIFQQ